MLQLLSIAAAAAVVVNALRLWAYQQGLALLL
jgi:hypothetical protein